METLPQMVQPHLVVRLLACGWIKHYDENVWFSDRVYFQGKECLKCACPESSVPRESGGAACIGSTMLI
jgi:hypothetical protein